MTDFKPYEPELKFNALVTKEEALLIKKIREIGYGSVTIHLVNKKIIRFEITSSELVKDIDNNKIKVVLEEILE
jgi:hypothetical protein